MQVPEPATFKPTDEQFFRHDSHGRRRPNPDFLREHFLREGRLTTEQAVTILRQATDLLASEANILEVRSPVTGMWCLAFFATIPHDYYKWSGIFMVNM